MDAAFSRVSFGIVSRSDRDGSAVKAAAYNLAGRLQHDGRRYDFRRKSAEHQAHAVLLPPGAPPTLRDPGTLWRAAEAAERRHDAQVARQVLLSIPREVAAADRMAFAQAVAAPWVDDGAAVQLDVHCPTAADGEAQPHAHILISLRRVTDSGLAAVKAREWNAAFRQDGGRAERGRIEQRGTAWLQAHGINARMDMRSLADRGIDRSPEPTAPRAAWEAWRRADLDRDATPPLVAAVLAHRRRRTRLAAVDAARDAAAAEVVALEAEIAAEVVRRARPPDPVPRVSGRPSGRPPTAQGRSPHELGYPPKTATAKEKPTMRTEPWMRGTSGYDGLSDVLQASARASYNKWLKRRPGLAEHHSLEDYVSYVQDRDAERPSPDQPAACAGSWEQGRAQRHAHLEALLAERYQAPAPLVPLVRHLSTDPGRGLAVLHLDGGVRLLDFGDRVEHHGPVTWESAEATAAAAAAHGWTRVALTGDQEYRDAVGVACALRVPPVETDHRLSRDARTQLDAALRTRAAAALPPLDAAAAGSADPQAAAEAVLAHASARAEAALAGRPLGSTSAERVAAPALADLAERCRQADDDAREATAAARDHRERHGWLARAWRPAVAVRQADLDREATALTVAASALAKERPGRERALVEEAEKTARATVAARQQWAAAPHVPAATRARAACAQVQQAVRAGDASTVDAAARGDLRDASAAARKRDQARRAAPGRSKGNGSGDARAQAVQRLQAAERSARPGADLARARGVTAAALAGDPATVAAAAAGDLQAAEQAAAEHRQRQQQEAAARARARERQAVGIPQGPRL